MGGEWVDWNFRLSSGKENTYLEQIHRNFIFHKILLNVRHSFFGVFLENMGRCGAGREMERTFSNINLVFKRKKKQRNVAKLGSTYATRNAPERRIVPGVTYMQIKQSDINIASFLFFYS